jgi:CRP-like cAMP-binding protein
MHPSTVTSIPLFASVPRRRRALVARLADEIEVPAGFRLIRQDGHAREFFVVVSGTAAVLRELLAHFPAIAGPIARAATERA